MRAPEGAIVVPKPPPNLPFNMHILAWNARGIARKSFYTHFLQLFQTHKPDIFILTETRTSLALTQTIVRALC